MRQNQPGRDEQPITPALDGDLWFRAKIVINRPTVRVYVNVATEPIMKD